MKGLYLQSMLNCRHKKQFSVILGPGYFVMIDSSLSFASQVVLEILFSQINLKRNEGHWMSFKYHLGISICFFENLWSIFFFTKKYISQNWDIFVHFFMYVVSWNACIERYACCVKWGKWSFCAPLCSI